jgi:hypothetical protein
MKAIPHNVVCTHILLLIADEPMAATDSDHKMFDTLPRSIDTVIDRANIHNFVPIIKDPAID